ncbi:MAG: hypothetical protein BWY87_00256 [Deltaproteobacteria bacterium ADurb.Bin510]|nr:MAG: hypothetical protein BWY87_00256 [Deltaproteobacteria bacterium ADurb.Bin510]
MDATLLLFLLPAFYCIQQLALPGWPTAVIAIAPLALAFVEPRFISGISIYGLTVICGMLMCAAYVRRRLRLALVLPTALLILASLAGLLSSVGFHLQALPKAIEGFARAMIDGFIALSPPEQHAELTQGRYELEARLTGFFPALLVMAYSLYAWLNLVLVNSFRCELNLKAYKASDWLLLPFIAGGLGALIPGGRLIGLNVLLIVLNVYFFQGMAIAASYMDGRHWPRFIKWLVYILLVIQLYIGVAVLGLFDTWFDFRKKIGNSEGEE